MNVIIVYLADFETWVAYERGVFDLYWIISMHDTRPGLIDMIERVTA